MFKNYVKVAFRNLLKRKGYTFINITGLAIGVACCLLISIYVINELSYDRFHPESEKIYRIKQTSLTSTQETPSVSTPFLTGPMLQAEYPQLIEKQVRFFDMSESSHTFLDREDETSFRSSNFYFTDSTFFDVFGGRLLRGNPKEALANPLSLIISEEVAEKYYPNEDPIGQTLSFHGIRSMELTITGIMESWPEESHMKIDMLASFSSVDVLYSRTPDYDQGWWWNPTWTYLKLEDATAVEELKSQLPAFADKYYHANRPEGERVELDLQPVTDIHLYSNFDQEMNPNGSIFYVYLFSAIAILILVIACVNFMNLATARSTERGREVGMRKVLGADRWQLFQQFMGESFLMSFFAVILAVGIVYLFMPYFNNFAGKELVFNLFQNGSLAAALAGLIVTVGLLAGIYPSLFLSGFHPTSILKGEAVRGSKGVLFRKSLVIFQFSLSVTLIIGTVLLYLQLQHMQNKKLGFDKDQIVLLPMKQNLIAWEYDQFRSEALRNPNIQSVTAISKILGSSQEDDWKIYPADVSNGEGRSTLALHVAYDFLDVFDINLIGGRTFSREFPTDQEQAIMINEEMLAVLDAENPQDAIGEQFVYETSDDERKIFSVVGVVDNFNYSSVKKEIKPMVIRLSAGTRPILQTLSNAAIKVAPGGVEGALSHLEEVWAKINYVDPFEYSFQDEELEKTYASEMTMSKVTGAFTLLCIIVACLGLFGLASFTASKRTKEIGIRKTLGASLSSILLLLSKDYIKLVLIANIVAWPVIYFLMNMWLQDFPNRINLGGNMVMVLLATAVLSVLICLLTVSYQSLKAALKNPVDSIKQE